MVIKHLRGGGKNHTLEVGKIRLLIERSALEAERVNDVVHLDGLVLNTLLGLLSGSVGADICFYIYLFCD